MKLVCLFCYSLICRPILGIYVYHSQIHEGRKWEHGSAVSCLGIHKSDVRYSVQLGIGWGYSQLQNRFPNPTFVFKYSLWQFQAFHQREIKNVTDRSSVPSPSQILHQLTHTRSKSKAFFGTFLWLLSFAMVPISERGRVISTLALIDCYTPQTIRKLNILIWKATSRWLGSCVRWAPV